MGSSVKAKLFYGYIGTLVDEYADRTHSIWSPECPGDLGYDEGADRNEIWAEERVRELARTRGGIYPYDVLPPPGRDFSTSVERIAAHEAWKEALKPHQEAWDAVLATFGADRIDHSLNGHDEFSGEFFYVKDAYHVVEWSDVKQITSLDTDPAWNEILDLYIEAMGIYRPGIQGPGWFLVSYYG